MILLFAAAMALLAPSEPQTAPAPGEEQLALPMADGFVVGHHQVAQNGAIEERVPRGETVEQWTRMITLLTINTGATPEAYLAGFIPGIANGCPGTKAAPQFKSALAGRRMIEGRLDCPLNPSTGKPETFVYRVYQGSGRLYMLQVAFRSVPSDAQAAWARKQLAEATICGGTGAACAK